MKVLVTGAEGQLGRELAKAFGDGDELVLCGRRRLDVTDAAQVRRVMAAEKPDAVIHAAAWTAVDLAESEPEEAFRVNALGTRNVAAAAAETGAAIAYGSTDYVFDGAPGRPLTELDPPNPLNVYGRTKLEGERFVRHLHGKWFIVRTSWLYGPGPDNFIGKVLRAARDGREIRVVRDEIGSPTYAADLAAFLAALVRTNLYGVYHAANGGNCSRLEFAAEALRLAGMGHVPVVPIDAGELALPARRPKHSALESVMIRPAGLAPLPDWRDGLARCLAAR